MDQTLTDNQRRYNWDKIAHMYSAKLLKDAPEHLKFRAKLYQNCLTRLTRQRQQTLENAPGTQPDSLNNHVKNCVRALVELSKRIDPEAASVVTFEIRHGRTIHGGSAGTYLPAITIFEGGGNGEYVIVQTPLWAHQMLLELVAWERDAAVSVPHQPTKYYVGNPHLIPNDADLTAALTLWAPDTRGVYRHFTDSMTAVKLLG